MDDLADETCREALDALPVSVVLVDGAGLLHYANRAARLLLDLGPQTCGRPVRRLRDDLGWSALADLCAAGPTEMAVPLALEAADGKLHVEVSAAKLPLGGLVLSFVPIPADAVVELLAAREELVASDRALAEVTAELAEATRALSRLPAP